MYTFHIHIEDYSPSMMCNLRQAAVVIFLFEGLILGGVVVNMSLGLSNAREKKRKRPGLMHSNEPPLLVLRSLIFKSRMDNRSSSLGGLDKRPE